MSQELIFTATYNEAENISDWIHGVAKARPDARILIVDDSSPDGTGNVIADLGPQYSQVTLVTRPGKNGLNTAHLFAMNYALEHNFDVLVTMDADGSHLPDQIPSLIEVLNNSNVNFVIGTRTHGGTHQAKLTRRILSRGANTVARVLLPMGVTEYTTSFRAFTRESLETLHKAEFTSAGYAFFIECMEILHRNRISMAETPIDFMDRTNGESKIPKSQIFTSMSALVLLSGERVFSRWKQDDNASN